MGQSQLLAVSRSQVLNSGKDLLCLRGSNLLLGAHLLCQSTQMHQSIRPICLCSLTLIECHDINALCILSVNSLAAQSQLEILNLIHGPQTLAVQIILVNAMNAVNNDLIKIKIAHNILPFNLFG